jgi:hypothetical protein
MDDADRHRQLAEAGVLVVPHKGMYAFFATSVNSGKRCSVAMHIVHWATQAQAISGKICAHPAAHAISDANCTKGVGHEKPVFPAFSDLRRRTLIQLRTLCQRAPLPEA